jgi:hypothetical protein
MVASGIHRVRLLFVLVVRHFQTQAQAVEAVLVTAMAVLEALAS